MLIGPGGLSEATMETAHAYSSDIAFTPSIKALQGRKGSRQAYQRMEERGSWQTRITPDLAAFIEAQTSIFLGTASAQGQPYNGGPAGFLRVLDDKTIGFVDYSGNRQFITQGNLSDNPKAHIFLIDYAHRRRIKIWGEARVVEGDAELTAKLMPDGYKARPEQVILFTVSAWDANCSQHIPQRFEAADVAAALAARDKRIETLEEEIRRLREAKNGDSMRGLRCETTQLMTAAGHGRQSRGEAGRREPAADILSHKTG